MWLILTRAVWARDLTWTCLDIDEPADARPYLDGETDALGSRIAALAASWVDSSMITEGSEVGESWCDNWHYVAEGVTEDGAWVSYDNTASRCGKTTRTLTQDLDIEVVPPYSSELEYLSVSWSNVVVDGLYDSETTRWRATWIGTLADDLPDSESVTGYLNDWSYDTEDTRSESWSDSACHWTSRWRQRWAWESATVRVDDREVEVESLSEKGKSKACSHSEAWIDGEYYGIVETSTWRLVVEGSSTRADLDCDGYSRDDGDCDDLNHDINPDAREVCDEIDNDCDGLTDDDDNDAAHYTWYPDADGDGYGDHDRSPIYACAQPSGYSRGDHDCDEDNPAINPGAEEVPYDGVDDDCSGSDLTDVDGDGYDSEVVGGTDCDDDARGVHPGATEVCNEIDDDCDRLVDDDDDSVVISQAWCVDDDGDGFGIEGTEIEICDGPTGYARDCTDCDDGDASFNADADEICDDLDNDCDSLVDDDDPGLVEPVWYRDADGDGCGAASTALAACVQPSGYVAAEGDMDDSDPDWYHCDLEESDSGTPGDDDKGRCSHLPSPVRIPGLFVVCAAPLFRRTRSRRATHP